MHVLKIQRRCGGQAALPGALGNGVVVMGMSALTLVHCNVLYGTVLEAKATHPVPSGGSKTPPG